MIGKTEAALLNSWKIRDVAKAIERNAKEAQLAPTSGRVADTMPCGTLSGTGLRRVDLVIDPGYTTGEDEDWCLADDVTGQQVAGTDVENLHGPWLRRHRRRIRMLRRPREER